jgi:hypothetical protein
MNGAQIIANDILVVKQDGKRSLERRECRWVDNIEIGWAGIDWIDVVLDRDQWRTIKNTVTNLLVSPRHSSGG